MYSINEHKTIILNAVGSWTENQEQVRKETGNHFPITLPNVTSNLSCMIEFDYHTFLESYAYHEPQFEDYPFPFNTFVKEWDQQTFIFLLNNLSLSDIEKYNVESVNNVITEELSKIDCYIENSYLNDREFNDGEDLKLFDAQFDRSSKINNLMNQIACAVLDNDQASVQIFKNKLTQLL
ncbi:uncharacterized protein METZ01_LOCUS442255 [marine metagenome]|uniref:Uncharacterized protein n=1 Tax=marine metagenome TaxID=408172 RepID=A0A382Z1U0_9ZZZZ